MMQSFSSILITRIQRKFFARYGIELTEAQAQEYLHSLADLFLLFSGPPD